VLIIAILDNGLNLLGVSAYPQLVIKGGGGDRGCAGEPEPATKRVNQIILNS
jgi:hypothetical protein